MSADATANCSGVEACHSGNIQVHDNPEIDTTTIFPPLLLFGPATGASVTGS